MKTIVRGKLIHFNDQAELENCAGNLEFINDGALLIENGKIGFKGNYSQLLLLNHEAVIHDYSDCYIIPGFIDAHVHSVQTAAIASYGSELLEWLENHIFPLENRFRDEDFARLQFGFFINQMLTNGTTTSAIFNTVHSAATDILFEKASELNLRIISGKTLMDRNAPGYLVENAQESYDHSKELISKWHNHKRLSYAVTPRFAITSSHEELELAGALKAEFPGLYVQTHISENRNEVSAVLKFFPECSSYLDVYAKHGLVSDHTLLAHCIHLTEPEKEIMKNSCAVAVHCPAANMFLGSGLFDFRSLANQGIRIAMGTDVGAGDSFSMFRTMNQAYKVSALIGKPLNPAEMFYLITLGGARALSFDKFIGNFSVGKEADFLVIDPSLIDLVNFRMEYCKNINDILFTFLMLGDERLVKAVYVYGNLVLNKMTNH